jgi:hypothetical protein
MNLVTKLSYVMLFPLTQVQSSVPTSICRPLYLPFSWYMPVNFRQPSNYLGQPSSYLAFLEAAFELLLHYQDSTLRSKTTGLYRPFKTLGYGQYRMCVHNLRTIRDLLPLAELIVHLGTLPDAYGTTQKVPVNGGVLHVSPNSIPSHVYSSSFPATCFPF